MERPSVNQSLVQLIGYLVLGAIIVATGFGALGVPAVVAF